MNHRALPITELLIDIDPARDTPKLATDWRAYHARQHVAQKRVARAGHNVTAAMVLVTGAALVLYWLGGVW
jgi:hypothetical protein